MSDAGTSTVASSTAPTEGAAGNRRLLSWVAAPAPTPATGSVARWRWAVVAVGLLLAAFTACALIMSRGSVYRPLAPFDASLAAAAGAATGSPSGAKGGGAPGADVSRKTRRLEKRLAALAPRGVFVTIDTFGNRLRIFDGDRLVREAVISTGSGVRLRDPRDGSHWIFDTPLGERRVERKARDPVWIKPDWAFVEEGVEPPADSRERRDAISLGDYALYLGDGYLVHGTLFQSLLGQGVTHGCIRVGDEDLEFLYRTVARGARVYLY